MKNNHDHMPTVRLFWTGGFDSSFRMVQLSRLKVVVQPYYLVDSKYRHSIRKELNAISQITEDIRNNPHTQCVIEPLIKVNIKDLKKDRSIAKAGKRLAKEIKLGIQYEWLARFAKENPGIELSIESNRDGTCRIYSYLIKAGALNKVTQGDLTYLDVDKSKSHHDMISIFGNLRLPLPLREMTKLDMMEEYKRLGFEEAMNKTWFCHNPVKNEPCGVCNPCMAVVKEGLSFRLTPAGLKRHQVEVRYGGQFWFRIWKKIRWRIIGF